MTLNIKRVFSFYNLALLTAFFTVLGCASIQRPMGGPRDKTPPKLLKATPVNQTRNFNAKIIKLDFDEYFKLVSQYQEISLSPAMEKLPEYNIKDKSLVIKLKDTLAKNTTYVINFGKAIADVNEGNILKNFTYVFSTGAQIDSLSIKGTVQNIETVVKEKDVTVMLIPAKRDTAYYGKKKPAIYTTTDSSGNFTLGNLKEGIYNIYALKETSPNKIYDNDDELIAFQKNPINLKKDTTGISLKLFKQIPARLRPTNRRIDIDGKMFFTFNKGITKPGVRILDKELDAQKIVDFSPTADTAIIYLRTMAFDSIKVSFLEGDTPLDTLTLRRSKKETYKRRFGLQYSTSGDQLKPGNELTVTANYPIDAIDASRISLLEDSVTVEDFKVTADAVNPRKFSFKYKWRPERLYDIAFNEGALTSMYGDKNPKLNKHLVLDNLDNYSTLTLKVAVPDTGKHYILQLLNIEGRVIHSDNITKNKQVVYSKYPIGKYKIKVIYDANANGTWDTGNIKQKIQPENIWLYDKEITLRTNFEIEQDLLIPKEGTKL